MKKHLYLFAASVACILSSCTVVVPEKPVKPNFFRLWNDCTSLTYLKEYVEDVTNPFSKNYIKPEDRIATFDMDGTFIGELYPTYFEYNLLEYRGLGTEGKFHFLETYFGHQTTVASSDYSLEKAFTVPGRSSLKRLASNRR